MHRLLSGKPTKELKAILPDERDLRDQLLLEMQTEIKSKKKRINHADATRKVERYPAENASEQSA